jgi:hypothetical protein
VLIKIKFARVKIFPRLAAIAPRIPAVLYLVYVGILLKLRWGIFPPYQALLKIHRESTNYDSSPLLFQLEE